MDKVYLKDYTVVAKHGYHKEEHAKPQRFIVSVVVSCDTKKAGQSDDLRETINYERIRAHVYETLMQSPNNLIETLAEEIAVKILRNKKAVSVKVEIQKPDVWNDCLPGVKITRGR